MLVTCFPLFRGGRNIDNMCVCKGGCNLVYEIVLWLQNRHRMILLQEPLDPCLLIACIFRPNATWNMFRWLC